MLPLVCIALLLASALVHSDDVQSPEDITAKFAEPIDFANQLLYDLDQQIQLIINRQGPSKSVPPKEPAGLLTYADSTVKSRIESLSKSSESLGQDIFEQPQEEEQDFGTLLNNLGDLDKKLQGAFQDLQSRKRFVLGAMIRQMQTTVRRIRTNVSRMQAQLISIESVATQLPSNRPNATSVDTAAANKEIINQIELRLSTVSRRINDIVVRLSSSLSGSRSTADGQPVNPISTLNSIIHSHKNRVKQN